MKTLHSSALNPGTPYCEVTEQTVDVHERDDESCGPWADSQRKLSSISSSPARREGDSGLVCCSLFKCLYTWKPRLHSRLVYQMTSEAVSRLLICAQAGNGELRPQSRPLLFHWTLHFGLFGAFKSQQVLTCCTLYWGQLMFWELLLFAFGIKTFRVQLLWAKLIRD